MSPGHEHTFVFFDDSFALLSSPDVVGDSPARVLAYRLLCSATPRISARGMLAALSSAPRRLQRAMYLARQVELDEHEAGLTSARESWATLTHDLRWAARSARARRHLMELAGTVGMADAARAVDEVQRALGEEILPVMHGRLYVASFAGTDEPGGGQAKRAIHAHALSTWSGPTPTSAAFARLYATYLRRLSTTSAMPTRVIVDVVLALIASRGRDSLEARALVTAFAEVVSSAVPSLPEADRDRFTLSRFIDWLSALDDAGPPCGALLDLLAYLDIQLGLEHKRACDYRAGAKHLARALARDPQNPHALDALNGLMKAVQRRQQLITSSAYSPEELAYARVCADRLQHEVDGELSDIARDGLVMLDRRIHGHICDVAWRLGLDPMNSVHQERMGTLFAMLGDAELTPDSDQDYADWVLQTALEHSLDMAGLPWERLHHALSLGPLSSPFDLAARIEPPTAHDSIPARAERSTSPDDSAPQPTRWQQALLLWTLSWRAPIAKLAAATGLVLLVHGATVEIRTSLHQAHERAAYTAVVRAIERGDDPAALSSAAYFLENVIPDRDDPRARRVHELLEQALVRHTLQLAQRGQLDQAGAALTRYADLALGSPDEQLHAMNEPATEESLP